MPLPLPVLLLQVPTLLQVPLSAQNTHPASPPLVASNAPSQQEKLSSGRLRASTLSTQPAVRVDQRNRKPLSSTWFRTAGTIVPLSVRYTKLPGGCKSCMATSGKAQRNHTGVPTPAPLPLGSPAAFHHPLYGDRSSYLQSNCFAKLVWCHLFGLVQ